MLSVHTHIEVSAAQIIENVKSKRLKIVNCDIEKNYETGISVTRLSILLRYRGTADKQAQDIIESLERSSLAIKEVKWEHM